MEQLNDFLVKAISATEWPMFILLIGGGLLLVFYSKGLPYRFFGHAIAITRGKYDDKDAKGDVSSMQALFAAVAATVGIGNISGVAIAIYDGGPGVVFWIWMTALIGMCIKFYTGSLAIMFRSKDDDGKLQGGPMYYIVQGYRESFIYFSPFWKHPALTIYFWGISLTLFFVGALIFKKFKPQFADVL